jgi:hypothetical protein
VGCALTLGRSGICDNCGRSFTPGRDGCPENTVFCGDDCSGLTDARREGFLAGVQAFEREWYALEHRMGSRPYGFEIAGITAFLTETAAPELAKAAHCRDCADATGGVCKRHQEPECTCYEVTGGHQPGCAFSRPPVIDQPEDGGGR